MDIAEAIRRRKSIRGFKPDSVPKEVIREILDIAVRSPSGTNTQPWEFAVVTGEVLDRISESNVEMLASWTTPRSASEVRPYEGVYRQRQVDLAMELWQVMGIAREDREKRAEWMQRGLRFYDAPAAIVLYVDSSLPESTTELEFGIITQTICLAALNHGLGTCIEGQGVMYPDVVRKFTGIPKSKRIVIAIAIGYPDYDFPANRLETQREPIDTITTWCGFE